MSFSVVFSRHAMQWSRWSGATHVDALCLAGVNLESYMTKVGTEWWCAVCSKVMARKDHMKNHIQIHFPGQEVSCPYCATICKNTPSLKVHMSSCRKMSFLS